MEHFTSSYQMIEEGQWQHHSVFHRVFQTFAKERLFLRRFPFSVLGHFAKGKRAKKGMTNKGMILSHRLHLPRISRDVIGVPAKSATAFKKLKL